jgi:hypothetical protein
MSVKHLWNNNTSPYRFSNIKEKERINPDMLIPNQEMRILIASRFLVLNSERRAALFFLLLFSRINFPAHNVRKCCISE